ncbi:MAG: phage protease [Gammaproteobacteria bacterium]
MTRVTGMGSPCNPDIAHMTRFNAIPGLPALQVALHAAADVVTDRATDRAALCQAVALPDVAAGADGHRDAPEWVHLLPADMVITVDGRGPYRVTDAAQLAASSLQAAGGRLPIDENHSTDLAAPQGGPSPARGWIVDLQARDDGIWGRVEWTAAGKALMSDRAYRHISPAITHTSHHRVTGILRAALTNRPNLRGLAALNSELEDSKMDLLTKLREALGLAADADEAAVLHSVGELKGSTSLQSALAPIAKAAGLKEDADQDAVLNAVTTLAANGSGADRHGEAVTALQAELATVTTQLNELRTAGATDKATAFVDGEIARGRVGVKPLRDHYIAMHAADPARVEKEIGAFPILGHSGATIAPPAKDKDGNVSLHAEHRTAAKLLGIDPGAYAKTLAAEAADAEEAA